MDKKKELIITATAVALVLLILIISSIRVSINIKNIRCADRVEVKVPAPQSKKANAIEVPAHYIGDFSVSHYCPCSKCIGAKKEVKTSTGTTPRANHTIAADPRVIPLHSVVYIEGLGTYVVEDTGGAIKGHTLDVFVSDHKTAIQLGTLGGKKFKVYLLSKC